MLHVVKPGEHSPLGPSSADRWINCPASVKATEGMPDKQSVFAAEGSAAHFIADLAVRSRVPAATYIGDIIAVGEHKFGVTAEWAAHIQDFLDWCAEIQGEHYSEMRLHFDRWVPGGFGTTDRVIFRDSQCWLRDLKFGTGVQVFAKDNAQLMLYALGVLDSFDWAYNVEGFHLGIGQPRLDHKDEWFITTSDLLSWAAQTLPAAVQNVNLGKPFKAGSWCSKNFCKIRTSCRHRAEQLTKDIIFEDLDKSIVMPEPSAIHIDRSKYLGLIPLLKTWIADLERGAVADLIAGKSIPGWKLVEGRSNRAWSNPDGVAKRISPDDAFEKSLRSPAQLEKLLGKPRFAKILGDLVHKPPGKPTLAPGSDPRDEMDTTSQVDFRDLDNAGD